MIDSARSLELVETVFEYAQNTLTQGGNLAVKIFQGSGTDVLLKRLRTFFKTVKCFKPEACRGESAETYFIGSSYC
jgi:23S rRNA (uridine2552-2'-O)-methyltransferase